MKKLLTLVLALLLLFNTCALANDYSGSQENEATFETLTEARLSAPEAIAHLEMNEGNIYGPHPVLNDYPCVSFEQKNGSMFLAEEILSDREYPRTIRTCDRATNLNLMVGLNAYTLCSGIICEELNGDDFIAVPFRYEDDLTENQMTIGYITRRNTILSDIGTQYVSELKKYLAGQPSLKEPDYYI